MRISEKLSPQARKVLAVARNALFEGPILEAVKKAIAASEPQGLPHVFGAMVVKLIDRANADDQVDPTELWSDEGVAEHLIEDMFMLAAKSGVEFDEAQLPDLYDETMDSVEQWASEEPPQEQQPQQPQQLQQEQPIQSQQAGFLGGA